MKKAEELDFPLNEFNHRKDGTALALLKGVKYANKAFAIAVNLSDGCMCGFEVHILRRQHKSVRSVKDSDGSIRTFEIKDKYLWRYDEDFGKKAWSYPDLNKVYQEFPIFKDYKLTIIKNLDKRLAKK